MKITNAMRLWAGFFLLTMATPNLPARESQDLLDGWRYQKGDEPNAAAAGFSDAAWQKVSLPHCWGWDEAQVSEKY